MKCTNRILSIIVLFCFIPYFLTGCGTNQLQQKFDLNKNMQGQAVADELSDPFAINLCVSSENVFENTDVDLETEASAGLFDLNRKRVIYAKDIHERLNPASLTKIMTAVVALKYGDPDDMIVCSPNVKITESGATLCGLKAGDKLTLHQALHALLIHSSNDAAVAIAEHIGGSVEQFAAMTNEELLRIGATNSHFSNPHGLTEAEHYTTAYDMYLIMNEAVQYSLFNEIIQKTEYSSVYYDSNGNEKDMSFKSTNMFFRGNYTPPDKITVIGGKTGTTNAAGSCLVLLTKDPGGNPYISVILHATQRDLMYQQMIDLLEEINN